MPRARSQRTIEPSKMSKKELEKLLLAREAEYQELSESLARSRKKRKRLQQTLDAEKSPSQSDDIISYPTGEVPGRGNCQLIDFFGDNKPKYNSFLTCVRDATIAAGIPRTCLWKKVPPVALGEVLDVVREQHPWLSQYENDWPATSAMKQFLRNSRNKNSRDTRNA